MVFELEVVPRRVGLAAGKQGFVELARLGFAAPGQRGFAERTDAQVVELSGLGGHTAGNTSKAAVAWQLSSCYADELSPASYFAQFAARMMLVGQRLKIMS